jgi:hypothetical protein
LRFVQEDGFLRAEVDGEEDSLAITQAYWQALAVECERRGERRMLVVDRLRGSPPSAEELVGLVHALRSTVLVHMRIAMYEPVPAELPRLQHVELEAFDVGGNFRVFTNEPEAIIWLRYGKGA